MSFYMRKINCGLYALLWVALSALGFAMDENKAAQMEISAAYGVIYNRFDEALNNISGVLVEINKNTSDEVKNTSDEVSEKYDIHKEKTNDWLSREAIEKTKDAIVRAKKTKKKLEIKNMEKSIVENACKVLEPLNSGDRNVFAPVIQGLNNLEKQDLSGLYTFIVKTCNCIVQEYNSLQKQRELVGTMSQSLTDGLNNVAEATKKANDSVLEINKKTDSFNKILEETKQANKDVKTTAENIEKGIERVDSLYENIKNTENEVNFIKCNTENILGVGESLGRLENVSEQLEQLVARNKVLAKRLEESQENESELKKQNEMLRDAGKILLELLVDDPDVLEAIDSSILDAFGFKAKNDEEYSGKEDSEEEGSEEEGSDGDAPM